MAAEWWDTWGKELCLEPSVLATMAAGILVGSILMAFGVNVALPYLKLTDAWNTANFKLVISLTIFQTISSPLGSYLLLVLDQKKLELCLAGALLLVLLAQPLAQLTRLKSGSTRQRHAKHHDLHPESSDDDDSGDSDLDQPLLPSSEDQIIIINEGDGHHHHIGLNGNGIQTNSKQNGGSKHDLGSEKYQPPNTTAFEQAVSASVVPSIVQPDTITIEEGLLVAPSLPLKQVDYTDSSSPTSSGRLSHASSVASLPLLERPGTVKTWMLLLALGAVVGTLSGVMGTLTSIGGPPMAVMYIILEAEKATVRGTNAVLNCMFCVVLLINYIIAGVFTWKDSPLYAIGAIFGFIGTLVGNSLSRKMSQQTFASMLTIMVVVCAVLMFASGLGWMGN